MRCTYPRCTDARYAYTHVAHPFPVTAADGDNGLARGLAPGREIFGEGGGTREAWFGGTPVLAPVLALVLV